MTLEGVHSPRWTGRVVIRGGLVVDGTGVEPFRADVAFDAVKGQITAIGDALEGDHAVDATDAIVMPGLIDAHAHPSFPEAFGTLDEEVEKAASYHTLRALAGLRATLEGGVTTVRDAAGADAGLRRAIAEGLVPGPRLLLSLSQLSPSAGPYDGRTVSGLDTWVPRPGIPSPVADGVDGVRAKVREYVQAGADVIKIFASGHFSMPRDGARRPMFTDDELQAIVDEATRQGVKVMAHAHGSKAAASAARAGVASIEHGFFLDDDALDAMAGAGTVFVPTLCASAGILERAEEAEREGIEAIVRGHRDAVREARRRGIAIAMGTDCPVIAHGRNAEELALLVECGLSPLEAIAAATSVSARLLGLEDEIGRITVGHRADVLVVDGGVDIDAFRSRLRHVIQGGRKVGPSVPA